MVRLEVDVVIVKLLICKTGPVDQIRLIFKSMQIYQWSLIHCSKSPDSCIQNSLKDTDGQSAYDLVSLVDVAHIFMFMEKGKYWISLAGIEMVTFLIGLECWKWNVVFIDVDGDFVRSTTKETESWYLAFQPQPKPL